MLYGYVRSALDVSAIAQEVSLRRFSSSIKQEIKQVFIDSSPKKEELSYRDELAHIIDTLCENDMLVVYSIDALSWRVGELVRILSLVFGKKAAIALATTEELIYADMPVGHVISLLDNLRQQNIKAGRSLSGRPKGSLSKSKYDEHLPRIIEYLKTNRNVSALARELGISRSSLKDFIVSRGL